jgi:ElaB/YqjD/DUF883 family membrane-anchored ribosome-binding protein
LKLAGNLQVLYLSQEDNMDIENNKDEDVTPKYTMAGEPGSDDATAKSRLNRGAEVSGQTEQSARDVHDKTAQTVSETYEQVKSYSSKNPGKTILIALGIGVGLGLLLSASGRPSRTGRFARPVVNALSEIALEVFR